MQILPVLDLLHGNVVRAIGGRRDEYRPIVSKLTSSAEPAEVAKAFRAQFGFNELYLADLDAIMRQTPASATYDALHREGFRLWVDAGLRNSEDATFLHRAGIATIVAGLETLLGPDVLGKLCREFGATRIVFSLDLRDGHSLGNTAAWGSSQPSKIVDEAIVMGIRRLLLLDLAHVGTATGTGTVELCRQLAKAHPEAQLAAGGGVRGMGDVQALADNGVETVLIASALHDGRITALDL